MSKLLKELADLPEDEANKEILRQARLASASTGIEDIIIEEQYFVDVFQKKLSEFKQSLSKNEVVV